MSRVWVVALGFVTAAGVVLSAGRQQSIFHSGAHAVPLYATVLDPTGRLVTDLRKDDFEVYDNGVRQNISVFANDVQPITIVIMLDRSGSMVSNYTLVRDAAERFVANLLEADRARLGSFSNRVQIDPVSFTSDRNELIRILHEDLQGPGMTPLWNATSAAMIALREEQGRRVVLIFTDGIDTPDAKPNNATFSEVRQRSADEGVMVYAIGLAEDCVTRPSNGIYRPRLPRYETGGPQNQARGSWLQRGRPGGGGRRGPIGGGPFGPLGPRGPVGPGTPTAPVFPPSPLPPSDTGRNEPPDRRGSYGCTTSKPDPDLRELASVGGGGYFELHGTDDLGSTFARVADELHHQYLIGFNPSVLDGKTHTIDVRVLRPELRARARNSYLAIADE